MNSDQYLLGGRFAPITSEIGFVKQPLEVVAAAHLRSLAGSYIESSERTELRGTLGSLLGALQPLVAGFYSCNPRELLVSCGEGEWTAYFNCDADGGLPHYSTWVLAELFRCESLVVSALPFEGGGAPGENSVYHLQPAPFGAEPEYTHDRSIYWGDQGGGQFLFDSQGEANSFEREGLYEVLGREQFPLEALIEYSRAVGVDPFEESFYSDTAVLFSHSIRNYEFQPEEMLSFSDARTRLEGGQGSRKPDEKKRIRHIGISRYSAQIQAAIMCAAEYIPLEELKYAFEYIYHYEGPLGMEALAWTIVQEQIKVPARVIATLRKYEAPEDDFPPNLEDYILPE